MNPEQSTESKNLYAESSGEFVSSDFVQINSEELPSLSNSPETAEAMEAGSLRQSPSGDGTEDPAVPSLDGGGMSKRQARKLKRGVWDREKRKVKREEERRRKKARKLEKRLNGEDVGPSRKELKRSTMADSDCKTRVVLDMSFDSYMNPRDIKRTYQQIQHTYAANRRAKDSIQLHLTSFDGPSRKVFDSVQGSERWDLNLHTDHFKALFPQESIVYLTSDSSEELKCLDDSKVYIIGGIIDHNHHKELCLNLAKEKGWQTARLPIDQYLKLNSRKVLTINQVFEILLKFTEYGSWEKGFSINYVMVTVLTWITRFARKSPGGNF